MESIFKYFAAPIQLLILILCVLLMPLILHSQIRVSPKSADQFKSVDYSSFYPYLILEHQIGNFGKSLKNPVFSPADSGWDSEDVADPFLLVTAESVRLFYDGSVGNKYQIGWAERDPSGWYWQNRKMIRRSALQNWEKFHQIAPAVLLTAEANYMFYSGNRRDEYLGYQSGLLIQKDADLWENINPRFFKNIDQQFSSVNYHHIFFNPVSEKYELWFSGFSGPLAAIYRVTAASLPELAGQAVQPVFENPPGAISPFVLFDGKSYQMYYCQLSLENGFQTNILKCSSADTRNWSEAKLVLSADARWEGRKLMRPNISYYEGKFHLFYCAQRGDKWQIGESFAHGEFEAKGSWDFLIESTGKTELEILAELSPDTGIKVYNAITNSEISLQSRSELATRQNVFRCLYKLDAATTALQIELFTGDTMKSPVIYRVRLL